MSLIAPAQPLAWRQEVFPHSPQQARELVPLLARNGITKFNLPNKRKDEGQALVEHCRALVAALPPDGAVCCHWSCANNYRRNPEATYEAFAAFCGDLAAVGRCSLLLVSGSQRKKLDTVATLERAAADPRLRQLALPLAVAFNPYLPDEQRQQEERKRLRRKLEAGRGMVTAIYLQTGSDVGRLEAGLQWLRALLDELEQHGAGHSSTKQHQETQQQQQQQQQRQPAGTSRSAKRQRRQGADAEQNGQEGSSQQEGQPAAADRSQRAGGAACAADIAAGMPALQPSQPRQRMQVYGSVLVPSKKLLAQMKFRPWGGVFLSEEYLSGVEAADRITMQLLQAYARHGVAPLVETEVASEAAAERVRQLLQQAPATA